MATEIAALEIVQSDVDAATNEAGVFGMFFGSEKQKWTWRI
jgi:hypothetical protein